MAVPVAMTEGSPRGATVGGDKAAIPFLALFILLVMGGLTAVSWSSLAAGHLVGNDDYLRLVQVRDWLGGAGWYQVDQPRLNPPHGTPMHWARLVDLPLVAIIAALTPIIGSAKAELAAVILVPGITLAAIVAGVVWAAGPLTRAPGAILAGAGVGLLPLVVGQITPGRIDHHGWQLVCAILMLGAAVRLVERPAARAPVIVAAIAGSLGVWIGQESVPWILAVHVALGLAWIAGRDAVALAGWRLGLGVFAGSVLALAVARPPGTWLTPACDALSVVTLGLLLTALIPWGAVRLWTLTAAPRTTAGAGLVGRCLVIGLPGVAALGVLMVLFPECRGGFFGDTDPGYRAFLHQIIESRPLLTAISEAPSVGWSAVVAMGLGATGLAVALALARAQRMLWVVVTVFFAIAAVGTVAQIRMGGFLQLFAALPLGVGAGMVWRFVGNHGLLIRVFGRVASLLALLVISLPAMLIGDADGLDADQATGEAATCDMRPIVPILDDLAGSGHRLLVAGNLDLAAPLLNASRHTALGGPYHRGADGALASNRLLAETDDAAARSLVRERGIDVVMVCPTMGLVGPPDSEALVSRLIDGGTPPWLEPVAVPAESALLVFRVRDGTQVAPVPAGGP